MIPRRESGTITVSRSQLQDWWYFTSNSHMFVQDAIKYRRFLELAVEQNSETANLLIETYLQVTQCLFEEIESDCREAHLQMEKVLQPSHRSDRSGRVGGAA